MIFQKACSRVEVKPLLFQDRRGRRSLQKLFYIAGAIHELPEINVPHKTNHQKGETEYGRAFVFKYSGS